VNVANVNPQSAIDRGPLPPLRFVPFVRPMVWGGRRLGDLLAKPLAAEETYGESWEVSDHPVHRSVIATGPLAGLTLHDLMERRRADLLGPAAERHTTFPWLVKFLDAHDWLSVQVHPDERAVKHLWPGEGSKTEAWFILDALPGSRIYAGLLPGVDENALRNALARGTVAECLHSFAPQPGDCVFLSAGTVHAVGGGVLLAEVQQTSDATFRLFDWNRCDAQGKMRTLHIEEGLASIDWQRGPVTPVRAPGFAGAAQAAPKQRKRMAECAYFQLDYVADNKPFPCGGTSHLQTLIVLAGGGRLAWDDHDALLTPGQVWVLPAAMPVGRCVPEPALAVLLSTLP
jgi:mannose-6-phosphate isomerase